MGTAILCAEKENDEHVHKKKEKQGRERKKN
jgi:hypothetical protein